MPRNLVLVSFLAMILVVACVRSNVYPSLDRVWWRQPVCLLAGPELRPCPARAEYEMSTRSQQGSSSDSRNTAQLVSYDLGGRETFLVVSPKIAETIPADDIRFASGGQRSGDWIVNGDRSIKFWDIPVTAVLVAKDCVPHYRIPLCNVRSEFNIDLGSVPRRKPSLDVQPRQGSNLDQEPAESEGNTVQDVPADPEATEEPNSRNLIGGCELGPNAAYLESLEKSRMTEPRREKREIWLEKGNHPFVTGFHDLVNASIHHLFHGVPQQNETKLAETIHNKTFPIHEWIKSGILFHHHKKPWFTTQSSNNQSSTTPVSITEPTSTTQEASTTRETSTVQETESTPVPTEGTQPTRPSTEQTESTTPSATRPTFTTLCTTTPTSTRPCTTRPATIAPSATRPTAPPATRPTTTTTTTTTRRPSPPVTVPTSNVEEIPDNLLDQPPTELPLGEAALPHAVCPPLDLYDLERLRTLTVEQPTATTGFTEPEVTLDG